jgi:hypothetical protein
MVLWGATQRMAVQVRCDTPRPLGLPRQDRRGKQAVNLRRTSVAMGDGNNGMNRLLDGLTAIVSDASTAILKIRAGSL